MIHFKVIDDNGNETVLSLDEVAQVFLAHGLAFAPCDKVRQATGVDSVIRFHGVTYVNGKRIGQ